MTTNNNTFNISNVTLDVVGNGNTKSSGLLIVIAALVGGAIAITACNKKRIKEILNK